MRAGQTPGSGGVVASIDDRYVSSPDDQVAVHGLATFRLRPTDATKSAASTTLQNSEVSVTVDEDGGAAGPFALDKRELSVYDEGTPLEYTYSPPPGVSEGANDDYQLVAAELDDDGSLPTTLDEFTTLLTDDPNADAEVVETYRNQDAILDDEPVTFQPERSGRYVLTLVQIEDSADTDPDGLVSAETTEDGNQNLTAASEVTVIGADSLLVQEGASTVTSPPTIGPDGTASVPVDAGDHIRNANDGGDQISHTLLLVNETKLHEQQIDITANSDGSIQSVDSSIEEIVTDSDLSSGAQPFGTDIGTDQFRGVIDVTTVIDDFADPDNAATSDAGNKLYASVGTTVGNAEDTVELSVPQGTPEGSYTLLHVATIDGDTRSATTTAEARVQSEVGLDVSVVSPTDGIDERQDFTVRVDRNDTGEPTEGAVAVTDSDGNIVRDVTTDSNGEATLEGLDPERYTVIASKTSENGITFTDATTTIDVANVAVTGPAEVAFDARATPDGSNNVSKTVPITNDGGTDVDLRNVEIDGDDDDRFELVDAPSTVPAGGTVDAIVEYTPVERDTDNATLSFDTAVNEETQTVTLSGTGTGPNVDAPSVVEFGDVKIGDSNQTTVTIENTGDEPLEVTDISAGPPFEVLSGFSGFTVPAGGTSDEISVAFYPDETGVASDTLTIETNDEFDPTVGVGLGGTGAAPELELSPSNTLEFGDVPRGENRTQTVSIANTGTADLEIDTVSVSAPDSDSFTVGSQPGTIPAGESELVAVTFENATAAPDATVDVTTGNGETASVDINATVLNPDLADPDQDASFGAVPVGSTTSTTVEVGNDGEADLNVNLTTAFSESDVFSLGTEKERLTVPAGESRSLPVQFSPTDTGPADSVAVLPTNDPDGDLTITASGNGTDTNLSAGQSTLSLSAGRNASATASVTITNDGRENIESLDVAIENGDGAFRVVEAPSSLGSEDDAEITVAFGPAPVGSYAADLTVTGEDTTGSTESFSIALDGESLAPNLTVDPESLGLGYVGLDNSNTRTVRVSNTGPSGASVTLDLDDATFSGDDNFTLSGAPESVTLDGGENVQIPITFDPDTEGSKSATVEIPTDYDGPVEVDLTGTALGPEPNVTAPASGEIDFGKTPIEATSDDQTVTVTNEGGAPFSIEEPTADEEFVVTGGPNRETLVPGAEAEIEVAAAPDSDAIESGANATLDGMLAIETTDGDLSVDLTTVATKPIAGATISGESFDGTPVGSSATKTVNVTNTGEATLRLDAPIVSGSDAFTVVSGDSTDRLAPGERDQIVVAYAPQDADGTDEADLAIGTNDPDTETITYELAGSGIEADVQLSDGSIGFGRVGVDETSTASLAIQNTGQAEATITEVRLAGDDAAVFDLDDVPEDGAKLPGEASEGFDVSVTPDTTGSLSAQVLVKVEDTEGEIETITASLGATGTAPKIDVDSSATFDRTRVGAVSEPQSIEIRNTGNAPLDLSDVDIADGDEKFRVVEEPDVIEPESSDTVTVVFAPGDFTFGTAPDAVQDAKDGTPQTATLDIASNASDTSVPLSGTGKTVDIRKSSQALQFGTIAVGDTATRNVTIRNDISATADVRLERLGIFGSSAISIQNEDEVRGTTLAPGQSTTITVALSPERFGIKSGVLGIRTNDPRQPAQAVFVSNSRTIVRIIFGSVVSDFREVEPGQQPAVEFDRGLDTDASLTGVQPTVSDSTSDNFTIETNGYDDASESDAVEAAGGAFEPLRYVEATTTSDSLEANTFRFRVSKSALSDLGTTEDNVTMYRYDDSEGAYESLPTELVGETRTDYVYEATTGQFSTFAIGADQPNFELTDASVDQTDIEEGDSVTVTADVENTGSAAGETTVSVDVAGTTEESQSLTIDAGNTRTATFTLTFDDEGDYTVSVGGSDIGSETVDTISVSSSGGGGGGGNVGGGGGTDPDDDDDPNDSDDTDDDTGDTGGTGGTGGVGGATETPTPTVTTESPTPTETTETPTETTETPTETTETPTETTETPTEMTETPSPDADPGVAPSETTTGSGPGFTPLVTLVAVLLGLLAVRRRTQ